MSDNPQPQPTPSDGGNSEHMIPKSRFDEVNNRMKEAEAAMAKIQQAENERLEKERLAKGEHEKVIADLRPKAERLAQVETALGELLTSELASIPEERKAGVDVILNAIPTVEGKLTSLRALQSTFLQSTPPPKPTAPPTNAGAGNGNPKPPNEDLTGLNENQLALVAEARASGHIRDLSGFIERLKATNKRT